MGEQPIFTTKAHVFQIDPATKKKWLPASSQSINVSFYFDSTRNTYRIISVEGSKAIINSTILPNMTFTKTSVKFGQWSDSRANTVYGLGFGTEADLTKFVEKFKEVKELTRQAASSGPGSGPGLSQTNGSSPTPDIPQNLETTPAPHSPATSPKPSLNINTVNEESRVSAPNSVNAAPTTPSLPTNNQLVEQLKYENDRLKIALAQSSANAKKWEIELQTLKNNNARLTTALQESTSNVEEWKKQLAIYKEESNRMKKKYMESEKGATGGSEIMQRQLTTAQEKVSELEKVNKQKHDEIVLLNTRIDSFKSLESQNKQQAERLQNLEQEKEALQKQNQTLREQTDGAQTAHAREKQQLRHLQEQLGSKVSELYGLSDKMAEMLQH